MGVEFLQVDLASDTFTSPVQGRSEEDRLVAVLGSLNKHRDQKDKAAWFAAGILVGTPSSRIRNAAALALVDMEAKDAGESIVQVLRRPEIAQASGTLLYALYELGASLPLNVLVDVIEKGSYEGRATALTFLEDNRIEVPQEPDVDDARSRLRAVADSLDGEAAEAAQLALEYLDDR